MKRMKNQNRPLVEGEARCHHQAKRILIFKKLKGVVTITPFVILCVNAISLYLYRFDFWYEVSIYIIYQTTGHGVLLLLGYLFYAYYHRLCLYVKISIFGLLAINIHNILLYWLPTLRETQLYSTIIIIASLCLSFVFLIKNK